MSRVLIVERMPSPLVVMLAGLAALENPGPVVDAWLGPKKPAPTDSAERLEAAEAKRQRKNARRAAQFHRSQP